MIIGHAIEPRLRLDTAARQCHIHPMIDRDPTKLTLDDWIAEIAISEAEIAAGQSVPLEPIIQDLLDTAARLEADLAARRRHGTGRS